MKHIVLFGAGKSATVLIRYLISLSEEKQWQFTIADASEALIKEKTNGAGSLVSGCIIHLQDQEQERRSLIQQSSLVISLMPPALHFLIAKDCVQYGKHLLTASYVDDNMRSLQKEVESKELLFLCEMGLDPGIDHMSAMKLIHAIHEKGGRITSFASHCGGLVASESDDNPWHYKISWNPRNVVNAGKAGAIFKLDNAIVKKNYESLFRQNPSVIVPGRASYASYFNRDSLSYIPVYGLQEAKSFYRTTLRHPDFCEGWDYIVQLHLTDDEIVYNTDDLSVQSFFQQHLQRFEDIINMLPAPSLLVRLQLDYLGFYNDATVINKGQCSAADVLQWILERRLILLPDDKDLVVMLHEIEYELSGRRNLVKSWLITEGDSAENTAMARTVGLPLGIAARLILQDFIVLRGLHIPILPAIYEPVLLELQKEGIRFHEEDTLATH